jgi:thioredoxin reductase (NADPH)
LNREKFKDKRVLILGGGDGAFHAALSLNDHTRSLAIAYRSTRVKADQRFQEKLRSFKDIAVFPETELKSIQSRSGGFQAILKGPNGEITLKMDVILVKFGFEPRNDLVRGQCLLDQSGYIITDKDQKTSSKTIWAIGDVCNPYYPSLSTAAGHACIAVKNIASTVFS